MGESIQDRVSYRSLSWGFGGMPFQDFEQDFKLGGNRMVAG